MANRRRSRTQAAWWTALAALAATAAYVGTWRVWALTVLTWSMYELCCCPTICGVATREATPCGNPARGRLFACTEITAHQRLKADALWHLTGLTRLRSPRSAGAPAAAHRKAPLIPSPSEHGYVRPAHRAMTYLAVIGLVATTIQTAVGLAAP
jgi:hypothetical protein